MRQNPCYWAGKQPSPGGKPLKNTTPLPQEITHREYHALHARTRTSIHTPILLFIRARKARQYGNKLPSAVMRSEHFQPSLQPPVLPVRAHKAGGVGAKCFQLPCATCAFAAKRAPVCASRADYRGGTERAKKKPSATPLASQLQIFDADTLAGPNAVLGAKKVPNVTVPCHKPKTPVHLATPGHEPLTTAPRPGCQDKRPHSTSSRPIRNPVPRHVMQVSRRGALCAPRAAGLPMQGWGSDVRPPPMLRRPRRRARAAATPAHHQDTG